LREAFGAPALHQDPGFLILLQEQVLKQTLPLRAEFA